MTNQKPETDTANKLQVRDLNFYYGKFHALKKSERPNLSGGIEYVDSARHATYVKKTVFKKYSDKLMRRFKWKAFGMMVPPGDARAPQRSPRSKSRPSAARRTSSRAT